MCGLHNGHSFPHNGGHPMTQRSFVARMPLWGFVPLCLLSSAVGLFVLGFVAAIISNSAITGGMIAGLVLPPIGLVWLRKKGIQDAVFDKREPTLDRDHGPD